MLSSKYSSDFKCIVWRGGGQRTFLTLVDTMWGLRKVAFWALCKELTWQCGDIIKEDCLNLHKRLDSENHIRQLRNRKLSKLWNFENHTEIFLRLMWNLKIRLNYSALAWSSLSSHTWALASNLHSAAWPTCASQPD